jgi:two-component system chemotaxis response regulator CheB
LSRFGSLPAAHAKTGQHLRPGRVYVAPPGCHLLLPGRAVELSNGPRVNRSRPAVDAMFASAARWFGDRVAAVVLSGLLDDGAVGAALVAQVGGLVVVQEPDEAAQPSMPRAALAAVPRAITAPGGKLGELVSGMLGKSGLATWPHTEPNRAVGHQFAPQSLAATQTESAEGKLWASVATLEETAALARHNLPAVHVGQKQSGRGVPAEHPDHGSQLV